MTVAASAPSSSTTRDLDALTGKAVVIGTGHSQHWGTDAYFADHRALTAAAADRLPADPRRGHASSAMTSTR